MGNCNSGRRAHRGSVEQQNLKEKIVKKSYEYLNNNFAKFTQKNKIHIELTLVGKDMAQKVDFQEQIQLTPEQEEDSINKIRAMLARRDRQATNQGGKIVQRSE